MKYKLTDAKTSATGEVTYFYVPDDSFKDDVKVKKDVKVKQDKKDASDSKAKRKREASSYDEESIDEDEEAVWEECEDLVAERFMDHSTSWIKEGLKKYKLRTNGTKKQLAERLANKFTNEDDSGSESDNESD